MKRFLLSSVLLLALSRAAFGFQNDLSIQVPPMSPQVVEIDDPVFINNGTFQVEVPSQPLSSTVLYETSDTLDYTNNGVMLGIAGFDFETFPASAGFRHMANSFVNNGNGLGGGVITAENIFAGENIFQLGGFSGSARYPLNFENAGLATVIIRATNVINTGSINTDNTGLIDIVGKSLDLRRGQLVMTGVATSESQDYGFGGLGTNSSGWRPATVFSTNRAGTPLFTNNTGNSLQFSLRGSEAYLESTNPTPDQNGNVIWRAVFILDSSAPNVTHSVSFGTFGDFAIQWAGTSRNPQTGGTNANYFLFADDPTTRRVVLTPFPVVNGVPQEFTIAQSSTPFITGTPISQSFVTNPFPPAVTNDFAYVALSPQGLSLGTNQVIGGNPTNLPGRIQLTSSDTMDLSDSTISGANYLKLVAPNFLGNSNASISAAYADLNLGSASGSLVLSNLLSPQLPAWTVYGGGGFGGGGFGGGFGTGIEAFSGGYFFVSSNTPAGSTNAVSVTNDVRILIVVSSLQPSTDASQKDIALHAANDLQISDALNVFGSFFTDTKSLTITTNDPGAFSSAGSLILTSPDFIWSVGLPNLQYFTNWGTVSMLNRANFADNMPSLFSPISQAVPYKAFVNHGLILSQGAFVAADYFANSGTLAENPSGDITLNISGAAINTNGTLLAPSSPITINANSLFISNSVVSSDRTLTFNTPCFLSDGYAFGNQFGHVTNATLPNVVANGNQFTTRGGVQLLTKPATGDLLGTTITDISQDDATISFNVWAGEDRGFSPSGFAENAALGRLILRTAPNHIFQFKGANNNSALYVDSLQLEGSATNTDANGNYTAITIVPGMKIYYAQALANGISIAEKLNGKNGGGFCWVSNYAGVYSSTNLSGTLYNKALVVSTHIDSDGDTIVNGNDPTPIPAGWTFDVANLGPIACGSDSQLSDTTTNNTTGGNSHFPGTLAFPAHQQQGGSGGVSFSIAQGSYNGLFYETDGVKASSAGSFTAKLTGKGTFSGKLQLGAGTYSFSKFFDAAGKCTMLISGKNLAPLTLTLHLVNNNEIDGEVVGDGWTAQLVAFSAVNNASLFGTGKHSVVLSTDAGDSTAPSGGDSIGTMMLAKNGNIQWSGVLPDGGKVSQKSVLSKDGVWPLYSSLYDGNGALIGWLQLSNHSSDIGGSAVWVMPANQNALYPSGLTNKLDASGSPK